MQRHPAETPMADGTNPFDYMGKNLLEHLSTYLDADAAMKFLRKTNNIHLRGFFAVPNINHYPKFKINLKHHFPHWFNRLNKSEGNWLTKFHYASTQDYAKFTPEIAHLFASVKNGDLAAVQAFFIKNPTHTHKKTWLLKDGSGHPLWYWVGRCSSQDVKDFYYEKMTAEEGEYLLHHAVITNRRNEIERLLSEPALDINSKDKRGNTPLFLAGYVGHAALFHLFITHGADWLLRNAEGNTPFAIATQQGHIGIFDLLISHPSPEFPISRFMNTWHAIRGAEDRQNVACWNSTLLTIATRAGHHDIMALLLKNGARTFACDLDGRIFVDERRMVKQSVLQKDFNKPVAQQCYGHCLYPLLVAVINDDCAAIQLLADHGADLTKNQTVGTREFHAWFPLQFAARFGCTRAARLLLKIMADEKIEQPSDQQYLGLLWIALMWKNFDTAICLIEGGLTFSDEEIRVDTVNSADIRKWKKNITQYIEANISDEAEQTRLLALTEMFFSEQAERIPTRGCRIS